MLSNCVIPGLFHGLLRRYANVITNVRASQNGLQHFCRYGAQLASVRLVTFDITFGARFLPSFTLKRAPISYTSGKRRAQKDLHENIIAIIDTPAQ